MNLIATIPSDSGFWYLLLGIVLFVIYFIPSWIAIGRKNSVLIFFLNLFFGITGVVWLILFIWSCTSPPKGTKNLSN